MAIDKLTRLQVFLKVAERGSFSAAARDFQMSQSAASKAVAALERSLAVRLVNRNTRSVSLTEAGQLYYERCHHALAELEEADASVANLQRGVVGTLNVAAPVPFGLTFISPRVARFHAEHSALSINLDLSDDMVDLVEAGIDVAIRLGNLKSPGLVVRKLGSSPFVTVASPDYLQTRGMPAAPQDLVQQNCLTYTRQANSGAWAFDLPQGRAVVSVSGSYRSNNLLALKDAALAGLGVARLPLWMVDAEIRSGAMQRVLAECRCPAFDIHAVFPSGRQVPTKTALFVEFLRDELAAEPLLGEQSKA
jgi:DNA-binding transcriptional LysR family regulator